MDKFEQPEICEDIPKNSELPITSRILKLRSPKPAVDPFKFTGPGACNDATMEVKKFWERSSIMKMKNADCCDSGAESLPGTSEELEESPKGPENAATTTFRGTSKLVLPKPAVHPFKFVVSPVQRDTASKAETSEDLQLKKALEDQEEQNLNILESWKNQRRLREEKNLNLARD